MINIPKYPNFRSIQMFVNVDKYYQVINKLLKSVIDLNENNSK